MIDLSLLLNDELKQNLSKYLGIAKQIMFFFLKLIWIPIILAVALGIKTYKDKSEIPPEYTAKITFVEGSKLTSSTVPNISEYYGVSRTDAEENTSIISGILFSDVVIGDALFTPINTNSDELLINHYIKIYKPSLYDQYRFSSSEIVDSLSERKRTIYKMIVSELTRPTLNRLSFSSSEIKSLISTTSNEDLSFALVTNTYNSLIEFYQQNEELGYESTLDIVERKRDSTLRVLRQKEAELAQRSQRGSLLVTPPNQLPELDLRREITLTEAQYNTYHAQYDRLKASQNRKDVARFRQLNRPLRPLAEISPKIFIDTLIWSAVGFFGGLFFIFIIFMIIQIRKILKSLKT